MRPYTASELDALQPYTASELDALQSLAAALHAATCWRRDTKLAKEVLTLILMLRERDQVVAELLDKIDVLERERGAK